MKLGGGDSGTREYVQSVRAAATQATGQRIVDAFIARLLTQWFDEITLDRVAEDAGVTVQTVVRRFGGKEGLLASAAKIIGQRINATREAPPGDLLRLVTALMADYEQTGDAVIRLLSLEERHPPVRAVLEIGRKEHRRWISRMFDAHLENLTGARRERAVDSLVIVTDVYTWKLLRRDIGRTVAAATHTIKDLVSITLADISHPQS